LVAPPLPIFFPFLWDRQHLLPVQSFFSPTFFVLSPLLPTPIGGDQNLPCTFSVACFNFPSPRRQVFIFTIPSFFYWPALFVRCFDHFFQSRETPLSAVEGRGSPLEFQHHSPQVFFDLSSSPVWINNRMLRRCFRLRMTGSPPSSFLLFTCFFTSGFSERFPDFPPPAFRPLLAP